MMTSPETPKLDALLRPYVVSDSKNAVVGDPGSVPILGRFRTEPEAAAFISTLPEHETGRYNLDGPADDWTETTPPEQAAAWQADTDRAWQRGWTLLADENIAPLDHRLRDLLRVHDDTEFAKAPPRVRAALTDLLQACVAMLGRLPASSDVPAAEMAATEYVNSVFPNDDLGNPSPVRAEDAWRMVHDAFVRGFIYGT